MNLGTELVIAIRLAEFQQSEQGEARRLAWQAVLAAMAKRDPADLAKREAERVARITRRTVAE